MSVIEKEIIVDVCDLKSRFPMEVLRLAERLLDDELEPGWAVQGVDFEEADENADGYCFFVVTAAKGDRKAECNQCENFQFPIDDNDFQRVAEIIGKLYPGDPIPSAVCPLCGGPVYEV